VGKESLLAELTVSHRQRGESFSMEPSDPKKKKATVNYSLVGRITASPCSETSEWHKGLRGEGSRGRSVERKVGSDCRRGKQNSS